MSRPSSLEPRKTPFSSRRNKKPDETAQMDDPDKTLTSVAQLIEQLHVNVSSPHERELTTARLLGIAKAGKEARAIIGSHGQAMPLFVSILRSGTRLAKGNVATILTILCKDEDLRIKVLLGGCIPPLLSVLKSDAVEARKAAAEALYVVSSAGLSDVGMKIFVTEGVVPRLWDQLNLKSQHDRVVEGFLTGALRNLCGDKDGYWKVTLDAGGVDIIVRLLSSGNPIAQANAASLLARLMLVFTDSIPKIIDCGAVEVLLGLFIEKDVSVRACAAEALEALSLKSIEAKKSIIDANGMPILIGAVVAPSKEGIRGEWGPVLQQRSMQALANICGGISALILYLGELAQSPRLAAPVADIIGALAYTLMVINEMDAKEQFRFSDTESILIMLLKPRDNKLVQDRILEALACLYGNVHLSFQIYQSEAKKVLVGLITLTNGDSEEFLISSLIRLCTEGLSVWAALGEREGIQLLVSSFGLSSEQHQEYAVEMLTILTDEVDDSKWALTAAGGIPPLVQLIEVGSWKAREDSTHLLSNLCSFSEDIRVCVERAEAIPAFLWLLKNGGTKGQEAAAEALTMVTNTADSATINHLLAMLLGDSPSSKALVIKVLGHVLTMASHYDLVHKETTASKGLRSLAQVLNSSNEKTQEYAASVLADFFGNRQDICDSLAMDEVVNPCMKLLTSNTQGIATQSARALGALSRPNKTKTANKMSCIVEGDVKPLIKLAKTSSIDSAETAMATLANLLSNHQIAAEALGENVVLSITKVLGDGSFEGKKSASSALLQLLRHFPVGDVLGDAECRFAILAVVDSLNAMDMESIDATDALEVVALLARTKHVRNSAHPPCSALIEVPSSIDPLIHCLCYGPPCVQDKSIETLSRLCRDQQVLLADILISESRSIGALANKIMNATSLEVRVGGITLLICVANQHKNQSMAALETSGSIVPLINVLVDMIKQSSTCLEIRDTLPRDFRDRSFLETCSYDVPDPANVLQGTVSLWLLSMVSSFNSKNKIIVIKAGGLEILSDKLAKHANKDQAELEDAEGIWLSVLLAAILFQDASVVSSPTVLHIIPTLAQLLKSEEMINKFFAAQAIASLVYHGDNKICLAIVNSDAVALLTTLIGHAEVDMLNLISLSEEFSLVRNPDQMVLESLFQMDDWRVGSVAWKTIPLLVELLRPIPDRPGAPAFAVHLLSQITEGDDTNKLIMAEAGALDSLSIYLSLGPQESTEEAICELFRILFTNSDILPNDASLSCITQLIAVLRLGSRNSRLSAARALNELFNAHLIRQAEVSSQSIQPFVDMLDSTFETEQRASLSALIKLVSENDSKAAMLAEVSENLLFSLHKILFSSSDLELKSDAAELCFVLFGNLKVREMPIASECIEPLMMLIQSDQEYAVESGLCAFERLLDNEQQIEITSADDLVGVLVYLVSGSNYRLIEASICVLIKLGKDKTPRKLDMVNAGIIENCLELLPIAPDSICATIAELFRILTNSSAISKSSAAAKIVEPLFMLLMKTDVGLWGLHSALQALVNVLEKPQTLLTLKLTPNQVTKSLIPFLESPSPAIQQLSTELLSHLLAQEHFKQDITTKSAVVPLVQISGIGILSLQETAIKALENISVSWPTAVSDAGGIPELSKVITQYDPLPPEALWESAALILSNLLRSNTDYCFRVPISALVKMLSSTSEETVLAALNALIVQEKTDSSSAELMAQAGAVDSLLDLLRSHQCEEGSVRLLEALFNNKNVRESKASKYAIAPLAQYLLDPQTRSPAGRLLAALALGNLSQYEGLARATDSASACRALVILLEDQPTEEITMVAVCALQNFVLRSRTNRRAIAEAGGVLVIQELLLSPVLEIAAQAALLIKFLFSTHTLQEYVSNELIRSLTAALEKELWSTATVNIEVLRTIHVLFSNFHKLHISEAATLCIPHLIAGLKSGTEVAQDSILTTLWLLKQSWSTMPIDVSRSQATAASEAIPILQMLMKTYPQSILNDKVEGLLNSLPGCLTVSVKRASNLKHVMGGTNAYCRLSIGNGPSRQTKVVSRCTSPEWKEGFTWAFDIPPRGQMIHVVCRSKGTFGKTTLGRLTIQIDRVVNDGMNIGVYDIGNSRDKKKDVSSQRTIEMEISWTSTSNSVD